MLWTPVQGAPLKCCFLLRSAGSLYTHMSFRVKMHFNVAAETQHLLPQDSHLLKGTQRGNSFCNNKRRIVLLLFSLFFIKMFQIYIFQLYLNNKLIIGHFYKCWKSIFAFEIQFSSVCFSACNFVLFQQFIHENLQLIQHIPAATFGIHAMFTFWNIYLFQPCFSHWKRMEPSTSFKLFVRFTAC